MRFVRKPKLYDWNILRPANQIADIFTKPLPREKCLKHKFELNVLPENGNVEFGRKSCNLDKPK